MNYNYSNLMEWIRNKREEIGISQRELAKRTGISHSEISKIEGGLRGSFSFITLAKICKELDINIEILFDDIGLIEMKEEKEYYAIFIADEVKIFLIYAQTEGIALRKSFEFVMENNLIKMDSKDVDSIKFALSDNIEDFRKDYPNEVENFLNRKNNSSENSNKIEENKEKIYESCNKKIENNYLKWEDSLEDLFEKEPDYKEFFVSAILKNANIFKVHASNKLEAMFKVADLVLMNNLIDFENVDGENIYLNANENLEKLINEYYEDRENFKENMKLDVEKLDKQIREEFKRLAELD